MEPVAKIFVMWSMEYPVMWLPVIIGCYFIAKLVILDEFGRKAQKKQRESLLSHFR